MADTFTWHDSGEIADALYASYPATDPLSISFPRLHEMIVELDGFSGNPDDVTEARLEQIQMAWYDTVEG